MGFLEKLRNGLSKTKENFTSRIRHIFSFFNKVDDEFLDKLEETLILADVSVCTAEKIKNNLREKCKLDNISSPEQILNVLKEIISEILNYKNEINECEIILVVGINGVGKTTSIGKLAHYFQNSGKSVLVAAADTFRAAAVDQLSIWSDRVKCEIVKRDEGTDPGAVIFDSISKFKSGKFDILICDTAGRLHNKSNLMDELSKLNRIIDKNSTSRKDIFLVLDASTGQNMVSQVEEFCKISDITGLILTKLDGTAKGGAIISVRDKFPNIPIRYIGLGENIDDLEIFDSEKFIDTIFDCNDK